MKLSILKLQAKNYKLKANKGFTLLEMLVAVGILSIVILISLSSFLAVLNAQKKNIAIGSIQENLGFSMEVMLREIRMGQSYYCGDTTGDFGNGSNNRDCKEGGPTLTFKNYLDYLVVYRLSNGKIEKYTSANKCSDPLECAQPTASDFFSLTFPEITINDLTFYVKGSDASDIFQPRVTITVLGEMGVKQITKSKFNLQTTVSKRKPE